MVLVDHATASNSSRRHATGFFLWSEERTSVTERCSSSISAMPMLLADLSMALLGV